MCGPGIADSMTCRENGANRSVSSKASLRLAVCRKLLSAMGSKLEVASPSEHGECYSFVINAPAIQESHAA